MHDLPMSCTHLCVDLVSESQCGLWNSVLAGFTKSTFINDSSSAHWGFWNLGSSSCISPSMQAGFSLSDAAFLHLLDILSYPLSIKVHLHSHLHMVDSSRCGMVPGNQLRVFLTCYLCVTHLSCLRSHSCLLHLITESLSLSTFSILPKISKYFIILPFAS